MDAEDLFAPISALQSTPVPLQYFEAEHLQKVIAAITHSHSPITSTNGTTTQTENTSTSTKAEEKKKWVADENATTSTTTTTTVNTSASSFELHHSIRILMRYLFYVTLSEERFLDTLDGMLCPPPLCLPDWSNLCLMNRNFPPPNSSSHHQKIQQKSDEKTINISIFCSSSAEDRSCLVERRRECIVYAGSMIPLEVIPILVSIPFHLALRFGLYDARLRVCSRRLCRLFDVPFDYILKKERDVGSVDLQKLEEEEEEAKKNEGGESNKKKKKSSKWSVKKIATVGVCAAVGGAALFFTGGLAAPAVAPALGAVIGIATTVITTVGVVGSAIFGGTALALLFIGLIGVASHIAALAAILTPILSATNLAAIFGVTGAGIAGYKGAKRVSGLQHFALRDISELECLPPINLDEEGEGRDFQERMAMFREWEKEMVLRGDPEKETSSSSSSSVNDKENVPLYKSRILRQDEEDNENENKETEEEEEEKGEGGKTKDEAVEGNNATTTTKNNAKKTSTALTQRGFLVPYYRTNLVSNNLCARLKKKRDCYRPCSVAIHNALVDLKGVGSGAAGLYLKEILDGSEPMSSSSPTGEKEKKNVDGNGENKNPSKEKDDGDNEERVIWSHLPPLIISPEQTAIFSCHNDCLIPSSTKYVLCYTIVLPTTSTSEKQSAESIASPGVRHHSEGGRGPEKGEPLRRMELWTYQERSVTKELSLGACLCYEGQLQAQCQNDPEKIFKLLSSIKVSASSGCSHFVLKERQYVVEGFFTPFVSFSIFHRDVYEKIQQYREKEKATRDHHVSAEQQKKLLKEDCIEEDSSLTNLLLNGVDSYCTGLVAAGASSAAYGCTTDTRSNIDKTKNTEYLTADNNNDGGKTTPTSSTPSNFLFSGEAKIIMDWLQKAEASTNAETNDKGQHVMAPTFSLVPSNKCDAEVQRLQSQYIKSRRFAFITFQNTSASTASSVRIRGGKNKKKGGENSDNNFPKYSIELVKAVPSQGELFFSDKPSSSRKEEPIVAVIPEQQSLVNVLTNSSLSLGGGRADFYFRLRVLDGDSTSFQNFKIQVDITGFWKLSCDAIFCSSGTPSTPAAENFSVWQETPQNKITLTNKSSKSATVIKKSLKGGKDGGGGGGGSLQVQWRIDEEKHRLDFSFQYEPQPPIEAAGVEVEGLKKSSTLGVGDVGNNAANNDDGESGEDDDDEDTKPHYLTVTMAATGFCCHLDDRYLAKDQQVAMWKSLLETHPLFNFSNSLKKNEQKRNPEEEREKRELADHEDKGEGKKNIVVSSGESHRCRHVDPNFDESNKDKGKETEDEPSGEEEKKAGNDNDNDNDNEEEDSRKLNLESHTALQCTEGLVVEWENELQFSFAELIGFPPVSLKDAVKQIGKETAKAQAQKSAAFALSTSVYTLIGSLAVPMYLVWSADAIDNSFSLLKKRSEIAGKKLAEIIIAREHGNRPVTMVGFGFGANIFLHAILCIANEHENLIEKSKNESKKEKKDELLANAAGLLGLVENMYCLGGMMEADPKIWAKIRKLVVGRVVNVYNKNDWFLKFLFRSASVSFQLPCAMKSIEGEGVENVDVSDIVDSLPFFGVHLKQVLDRCVLQQ